MSGYLFIVHGDLTAIACDAILIPTDGIFDIANAWQSLDLKPPSGGWAGDTVVRVRANPREPRIWLGNIGKGSDATEFKDFIPVAGKVSRLRGGRSPVPRFRSVGDAAPVGNEQLRPQRRVEHAQPGLRLRP